MSCPDSGSPGCLCLSDSAQTMFGAFAAVAVMYAMIRRSGISSASDAFNHYCSTSTSHFTGLHQFWSNNAALFNPVLKIAGTQAPLEECLLTVLGALQADRLSELAAICLTDQATAAPAERLTLAASYRNGISLQCNQRKKGLADKLLGMMLDLLKALNVRDKVLLYPEKLPRARDFMEVIKAQCDYICALPADCDNEILDSDNIGIITAADADDYIRTYLVSDTDKPLCTNEDKHISGIFSRRSDSTGKTETESTVQCEFTHLADDLLRVRDAELVERQAYTREERDDLSYCSYFLWRGGLDYLKREYRAQSFLRFSRGRQTAGFFTSLPCLHQAEYLHLLQDVLSCYLTGSDSPHITLTSLSPAGIIP